MQQASGSNILYHGLNNMQEIRHQIEVRDQAQKAASESFNKIFLVKSPKQDKQ
ncbi:hypothetical protein [uncultured Acinetobacter sp.]|uniref:hypothetical protein n=1 Tax=uncultured Acinetobacter sp. TaxID=165433 RepID=UPI00258CAA6E|nr:hypothetical protein [uncultured Acinetobacter sp.]